MTAEPHQTFLFADIAGFTALTEAHGDEEAAELAASFGRDVSGAVACHGGDHVKTIGDALMIRVREPTRAIELGLVIVADLMARHGSPAVRVGMHHGTAVARSGDWFGAAVNLAARISGMAAGGEVLLSAATREAAGRVGGIRFDDRGRHRLRNVTQPVALFAARRQGERSEGDLPIDPVCRMAVDPARSAGRLSHEGIEHHFCSLECAAAFAAAPTVYGAPSE